MTKNLIVYNASAGSGKTYTLALEYIALSLQEKELGSYKKILAITFTNKAAHELKERIIRFMKDLGSDNCDIHLKSAILERTHLKESELKIRAQKEYRAMLYSYTDIHVSTIDSFVLSILRSFSKELGLAFDFEVEMDVDKILDIMVNSLLSQIGKDAFMTKQLAQLVTQSLDDGRSWNPKDSMHKALSQLMDEESIAFREELAQIGEPQLKKMLDALNEEIRTGWKVVQQKQNECQELIRNQGLEPSDFSSGQRGFISFAYKDFKQKPHPTSGHHTTLLEKGLASPAARKAGKEDTINSLREGLLSFFEEITEQLKSLKLQEMFYKNRMNLVLALRVQNLVNKLEVEEGISIIKDNNHKISALIADNPTPFIYERIGDRFQYFLIDEFQDTSVLQWSNMLPLIDGSLAYGNKNFLVGDVKQSIYRWRGGDVDQMVNLPKIKGAEKSQLLNEYQNAFERNLLKIPLETNYRSSSSVVTFNNELFTAFKHKLSEQYTESYKDVSQLIARNNVKGYVQVQALKEGIDSEGILNEMMAQIKESEQDGYYGSDICILSRNNKSGREIAKHLELNGHSVSSPDSLLLTGHPDIYLLMSFLEVISGSQNFGPALYALYRLLFKADKSLEYHQWASNLSKNKNPEVCLSELLTSLGYRWTMSAYRDLDVYESLQQLCFDLQIDQKDPYIQELLNQSIAYCQGQDSTLIGFVEYWKEKKTSMSVKAGISRSSIQVMTIHKSKGLQFPVVVIPELNWKSDRKTKKKEWVRPNQGPLQHAILDITKGLEDTIYAEVLHEESQKSAMDYLNLLYVACTRAEDRLYLNARDLKRAGLGQDLCAYIHDKSNKDCLIYGERKQKENTESAEEHRSEIASFEASKRNDLLQVVLSKEDKNRTQRAFGETVHRALEIANEYDQLEAIIAQLMPEKIYPKSERDHALKASQTAWKLEQGQDWNSEEYTMKREAELMDSEGNTYRIDKLYLNESLKHAIVVDYKTGIPSPKDVRQIQGYKELLRNMGWQNSKGYLVYTEKAEIQEV